MADLTKSAQSVILTHQAVTHPTIAEGTATTVSDYLDCLITTYYAGTEAAANTNSGSFEIQVSANTSGDEDWVTVAEIGTPTTTPAVDNLNSGGEAQGQTVIGVDDTTGYTAGNWCYLQDTTTLADSEWCQLVSVQAGTSLTILDGITTAKDDADDSWTVAQVAAIKLDLGGVNRIRVNFVHVGTTGCNCHVMATLCSTTAIA